MLFISQITNLRGNNHDDNTWKWSSVVRHDNSCIISIPTRHNVSLKNDKPGNNSWLRVVTPNTLCVFWVKFRFIAQYSIDVSDWYVGTIMNIFLTCYLSALFTAIPKAGHAKITLLLTKVTRIQDIWRHMKDFWCHGLNERQSNKFVTRGKQQLSIQYLLWLLSFVIWNYAYRFDVERTFCNAIW